MQLSVNSKIRQVFVSLTSRFKSLTVRYDCEIKKILVLSEVIGPCRHSLVSACMGIGMEVQRACGIEGSPV